MTQFFQVHPETPQKRIIAQAAATLSQQGLVVYPTDSYYAIGFMQNNTQAAERVRQLRGLDDKHLFTLCCRNMSDVGIYGTVDTAAFRVIKQRIPGAYTFVLQAGKKVSRHLCHPRRKTVAFRVPAHPVAQALIEAAGEPVITTTLRLRGHDSPLPPEDFRDTLSGQVDAVLDAGACPMSPTTVIDFSEQPPKLLRKGAGALSDGDLM